MTIQTSVLSNGMKIVSDCVDHVESLTIGLWANVGTRNETPQEMGMAHFLEHMVFKGTTTRSAQNIADEIESVGGHFNAYTSREQTAYYIRALSDHMPLALDILADVLKNSTFIQEEFDREKNVILQEIGQCYDMPDDIIFDHFMETTYPNQSAGWPILGTTETINNFTREGLIAFVNKNYTPEKIVLAAAGKVDHNRLVALAEELLGDYRKTNIVAPKTEATYEGGYKLDYRSLEQIHIVAGFRGLPIGHEFYYPMHVFSSLLGGGMSSKLFQEVREKRGLAYSIYSFCHHFSDGGTFGIYAGTDPDRVDELLSCLQELLQQTPQNIDPAEITRAQTQLKANLLMSRESMSSRCEIAAQHTLLYGQPKNITDIIKKIENVSLADITGAIACLKDSTPTLCVVGPWDKKRKLHFSLSIK